MGEVIKRIRYLNLSLERGTDGVPDDGRYYVVRDGEILSSAPMESLGMVFLEMAEEEILAANPSIKSPKQRIVAERGEREVMAARAQSAAIGKSKATSKGGKGGRSGV